MEGKSATGHEPELRVQECTERFCGRALFELKVAQVPSGEDTNSNLHNPSLRRAQAAIVRWKEGG